jgi:hypothetical protein
MWATARIAVSDDSPQPTVLVEQAGSTAPGLVLSPTMLA